MKFRPLLIAFLLMAFLTVSESLFSQRILGAFSAGMNLTQVDGDEKYGFHKVGLNLGPSVIIPFGKSKKWSVTLELQYSQLGSHQREQFANDTIPDTTTMEYYDGYKLKLDYVQVPVMVHFKDKNIIAGGVGFSYGQLVSAAEWEDYNDDRGMFKTSTTLRSPYIMSDVQVIADVRIRLYQRLWFNFRYSYSIYKIRTRNFVNPIYPDQVETRYQYNNVITLRLTYIFNEEIIKKGEKKSQKN
jgi:hypothetical protein